jgi:hypothetical protein
MTYQSGVWKVLVAALGSIFVLSACSSGEQGAGAGTGGAPFGGVGGGGAPGSNTGGSALPGASGTPQGGVPGSGGAPVPGMGGMPLPAMGGYPATGGAAGASGAAAGGGAGAAGSAGAGGAAGNGGGGGAAGFPPFPTSGMPMTAPDKTWTWVDFPDTKCRNGTPAGLGLSLNSASTKVMIFLQGGGACFDAITCLANPVDVSGQKAAQTTGVFDRTNAANPVKDWNFVFVPYCSGDTFMGTNDNAMVPGVAGAQHFMGRPNMEKFLNRIVPTFKTATQVLLTGISAGGFGAASNSYLFQRAFNTIPVTMIDDSGPPMSSKYIPTCLQEKWRTLWGLDGSILADCGASCPNKNDFTLDYTRFVLKLADARGGTVKSGLIESNNDGVITGFYGYGQNNCMGSLATPVPKDMFDAGLLELRDTVKGLTPNFGTYYPNSNTHTWISGPTFFTATEGGVKLVDWFTAIVNGTGVSHVGM